MSNQVAVVSGASRGIGRQLCIDLAAAGYDVACAARSSEGARSRLPGTVDETAAAVVAGGRRALAVALDVRDDTAVADLAERVYGEWGRCDLLVNNAAVAPPLPALEDSIRRWRLAVDVNLNGPFYTTYYFGRRMAELGGGRIVNVSSLASQHPEFGRASYTATKRGLEAMTEALAHDLRGRVAVDCLRIDLPIWSEGFAATLTDEDAQQFEHPAVVSDAMLWLAAQPLEASGRVLDLTALRADGVVRGRTSWAQGPDPVS
jgi:NAD(P)-dependent dehydrogenase (short-subunit alcohol dehydrogenase family)